MNLPPRDITCIHQIELTSRCNLACRYCPHPKMERDKIDMDHYVFEATLDWVAYFMKKGTQVELALTGIGEPTMHPDFVKCVAKARKVMGDGFLSFATNGILITEELCEQLLPYKPWVYVSSHRPEKAGPAVNLLRRYGLLKGVNTQFITSAIDWAGQVDWEVTAPITTCAYLTHAWGCVLSDGRVTTCCFDAHAKSIIGHVNDKLGSIQTEPKPLCGDCHFEVPTIKNGMIHANVLGITQAQRERGAL